MEGASSFYYLISVTNIYYACSNIDSSVINVILRYHKLLLVSQVVLARLRYSYIKGKYRYKLFKISSIKNEIVLVNMWGMFSVFLASGLEFLSQNKNKFNISNLFLFGCILKTVENLVQWPLFLKQFWNTMQY